VAKYTTSFKVTDHLIDPTTRSLLYNYYNELLNTSEATLIGIGLLQTYSAITYADGSTMNGWVLLNPLIGGMMYTTENNSKRRVINNQSGYAYIFDDFEKRYAYRNIGGDYMWTVYNVYNGNYDHSIDTPESLQLQHYGYVGTVHSANWINRWTGAGTAANSPVIVPKTIDWNPCHNTNDGYLNFNYGFKTGNGNQYYCLINWWANKSLRQSYCYNWSMINYARPQSKWYSTCRYNGDHLAYSESMYSNVLRGIYHTPTVNCPCIWFDDSHNALWGRNGFVLGSRSCEICLANCYSTLMSKVTGNLVRVRFLENCNKTRVTIDGNSIHKLQMCMQDNGDHRAGAWICWNTISTLDFVHNSWSQNSAYSWYDLNLSYNSISVISIGCLGASNRVEYMCDQLSMSRDTVTSLIIPWADGWDTSITHKFVTKFSKYVANIITTWYYSSSINYDAAYDEQVGYK
jgi:hypothetical protein